MTSCTPDKYLLYIPEFVQEWKKVLPYVDVKIILIASEIPTLYKDFEQNIILFEPLEGMHSSFISQYIRLLYPALLDYKNGVLITDIDMLPISSKYFESNIVGFSDDHFISYRDHLIPKARLPICYNVATPKVWSEIFYISSLQDIKDHLIQIYKQIEYDGIPEGKGWHSDEELGMAYILMWYEKNKPYVFLTDGTTGFCSESVDRKSLL